MRFKAGVKIEEINKKVGESIKFDEIVVHAGTKTLQDKTSKDLTETIITTLEKVQKNYSSACLA